MAHDNRKNGEYQLLERRQRVASLYVKGMTQTQIALDVGVTQACISKDLAAIRKAWVESAIIDFNERQSVELAKLDNLEAISWAAWERSCNNAETTHTQTQKIRVLNGHKAPLESGKMVPVRETTKRVVKGQAGDPRFLEQVERCIALRCKITGALSDTVNVSQTVNIDWAQLYKPRTTSSDETDPIEARILSVENLALPDPTTPPEPSEH